MARRFFILLSTGLNELSVIKVCIVNIYLYKNLMEINVIFLLSYLVINIS